MSASTPSDSYKFLSDGAATLDRINRISACRERHRQRWLTHAYGNGMFIDEASRLDASLWFASRYRYLTERLIDEINAADNVLGKQWHYDYACITDKTLDAWVKELTDQHAAVEAVQEGS